MPRARAAALSNRPRRRAAKKGRVCGHMMQSRVGGTKRGVTDSPQSSEASPRGSAREKRKVFVVVRNALLDKTRIDFGKLQG